MKGLRWLSGALVAAVALSWIGGCGNRNRGSETLTVYSGRTEDLVQPLIDRFVRETGIQVQVRYAQTSELAATLMEEGDRSPAELFLAQDAGGLGALAKSGRLARLPDDLLEVVDSRFRSHDGVWVGLSGRARVMAYNPTKVSEADLPASVFDLTGPAWRGRVGWAPANASFQAFVTAMRVEKGEEATRAWLTAMQANEPRVYAKNTAILTAVSAGEVDVGLTNHYYLHTMQAEGGGRLSAKNHVPAGGTIVNVSGIAILKTARDPALAQQLVRFLLGDEAQTYFAQTTWEYPLARGVPARDELPPLSSLVAPDLDLGRLDDLEGTLRLLQETGIL